MEKTFNLIIENNPFYNEFQIKDVLEHKSKNVHNIKICKLGDIPMSPNENFYYIVYKMEYLQFQHDETLISKIPISIKEALKSNFNFKIIFLELNESDFEDTIEFVDLKIKEEDINHKQVFYINANHKIGQLKNKCETDLNVYTINHGQYFNCERLSLTQPEMDLDKEFLFMVHNRNVKSHRLGLLCLLKKNNLLDYVDWSLLMGSELNRMFDNNGNLVEWFFTNIFKNEDIIDIKNEIRYFAELGDKKSIYESEFDFNSDGYRYDYNDAYKSKCYSKSYINITTETNYESPYIVHITEKTFNPFNFYQIPIFVATYQHVKYLRELYGFDMFDDLVNHSYDNEIDNGKRLFMIADEIRRLNENPQVIKDFYKNNEDRFIKNRNIIYEIVNDKRDYNFFQSLI
jgi:hypothetical protein